MKTENSLTETKNIIYSVLNELNEIHLIIDTSYNSLQDLDSITSQETLLLIEQILVDTRKNLLKAKKNLQDIESSDDKVETRVVFLFYSLINLLTNYLNILNERCNIIYKIFFVKKISLIFKYRLYQSSSNLIKIKKQLEKFKFQLDDTTKLNAEGINNKMSNEEGNKMTIRTSENTGNQIKMKKFNKPLAYSIAFIVCFVSYFIIFTLILFAETFLLKDLKIGPIIKFPLIAFLLRYVWKVVINKFK